MATLGNAVFLLRPLERDVASLAGQFKVMGGQLLRRIKIGRKAIGHQKDRPDQEKGIEEEIF